MKDQILSLARFSGLAAGPANNDVSCNGNAGSDAGAAIRRRAAAGLCTLWLAGALPTLLAYAGVAVPVELQVLGWGFWMPGAGFVAVGGWALLWIPLVVGLFWISIVMWAMSGMLVAPLLIWVGSATVAALISSAPPWPPTLWIVPSIAAGLVVWNVIAERRLLAKEAERGVACALRLPVLFADLDRRAAEAPDPRELDADQLAAVRYILDLALQPVGRFDGFTRIDNIQSASLRYQLNYISYALAHLQSRYVPSFHGYLNTAQQFAIESLTDPAVCGYWKWEHLWGRLSWHEDPIGTRDNIMLTGWSQAGLAAYTATTGDQRYQADGALPFRPSARRDRVYGHNTHSLTRSIVGNWSAAPAALYPCEPFWVFPLCNAYAFSGVVAYDRSNGTSHAADYRQTLLTHLASDFILPDGNVRPVLNTLTGWSWLGRAVPPQASLAFLLQLSRVTTVLDPALARSWYLLARDEFVTVDPDGRIALAGMTWAELVDAGNYRKSPGYLLSLLALAALEHGDGATATAALREVDERLERTERTDVQVYKGVSAHTNISLAAARFAARDDWRSMIESGPAPATFEGPLLTACDYPDVLVAAAHGDADGLRLILFPGAGVGPHRLGIDRLRSGSTYRVEGAHFEGATLDRLTLAEGETSATLRVVLTGRTVVRLVKET